MKAEFFWAYMTDHDLMKPLDVVADNDIALIRKSAKNK